MFKPDFKSKRLNCLIRESNNFDSGQNGSHLDNGQKHAVSKQNNTQAGIYFNYAEIIKLMKLLVARNSVSSVI